MDLLIDNQDNDDGNSSNKKESATLRAVKELRREALDRVRNGEAVVSKGGGEENNGRLIIHREVDLKKAGTTTAASKFNSNGTMVAIHTENNNDESSSSVAAKKQQPVRTGGILVNHHHRNNNNEANTSIPTPKWHAPYRLSTVISSHLGWVRSIAFDPTNTMFATGGGDRVIKIFDLAKACVAAEDALKITLTGHISPVRGLAFSERHPYLFSAGEDKMVKVRCIEILVMLYINESINFLLKHIMLYHIYMLSKIIKVLGFGNQSSNKTLSRSSLGSIRVEITSHIRCIGYRGKRCRGQSLGYENEASGPLLVGS